MDNADAMSILFQGRKSAHGVFVIDKKEGNKVIGKAITLREDVTIEKWYSHLAGIMGIGIVPINEENYCHWAAIDYDVYPTNYMELLIKIKDSPFVVCKSKSGGAHLYVFLDEPVPARDVREYLMSTSAHLGLGNKEIFPKQDMVITARGDVGNWLNMPYFGDTRKCIILNNGKIEELNLDQFIEYATLNRVSLKKSQSRRRALITSNLSSKMDLPAYRHLAL